MKLEKVKSVLSNILESKEEKSLANPVEPIETKVDVVDAETAEEDTEKINKEVNKRIKDIEKNALAVKGEDHAEEPKLVKESKEFKKEERKELGAFIHELKEKKIKHIVKRSVNEGYRYLVEYLNPVKEESFEQDKEKAVGDAKAEAERLRYAPLEDREKGKIFVVGDHVKYINNDGWTSGGEENIGRTGTIVSSGRVGDLEIFTVFADDERYYKGYENFTFNATADNLEFTKEVNESKEPELPKEVTFKASEVALDTDDENPEERLSDLLSDRYGYCHYGFKYEVKNNENGEPSEFRCYDIEWDTSESLKEEKEPIDLEALRFYVKNWSEGDNITVTADLLNVLEQALEMAEKHGLKESKLNEVDLETSSTKQVEIKPEKKDPSEEEEDKTEIVIKKEEEPVEEGAEKTVTEWCPFCEQEVELKAIKYIPQRCPNCGKMIKACSLCDTDKEDCAACEKKYPTKGLEEGAQGKKEPGVEFVVFDASTEGKAPILGIRSTRVEAEWLMNRLMKTGKYENVSFDEAPKGRFHKGDDFWGPFDDNWEKTESLNEEWQYCDCKDLDEVAKLSDYCAKNNCKVTAKTSTNDGYKCRIEGPFDDVHRVSDKWSMFKWKGTPLEEAIDTSKEVWEGWTVQDFIDELEPSFEQIMRGESWVKPFASKDELKKWCMSEQPYYKKYIPEVVAYFDGRVKEFGGYGKKASDGWFHEGVISGQGELSYDELAKLEEELYAELAAHNIHPEDGTFSNSTNRLADLELFLVISGDWKHDHLAAASVVEDFCKEKGYVITKHDEVEIGDSGSDWYDAEHTWFLIKDTDGKMEDRVAGFKKMFARPEDESLEEDINIKINKDNIEITEPTEEGEETVAVIETPKAGEESEVTPEEEQPEEGAPEESEEEIKEPVEEELGKETIYIKYWEDEELRDQGISEIYLDKFESVEDAKEVARKLIDRDGFASVEVFISPKGEIESADDKLVWGYDGVDTWTESLEKKAKAVVTDEEFKNIDEDDVSWMTSTDMSALKEAKVDEPEVKEPTAKKVVNFEDVEEDDISWLK